MRLTERDWEFERKPENFTLEHPFAIERWMCNNCGFIFDYHDGEAGAGEQFGWTAYGVEHWIDGEGKQHFKEHTWCRRCGIKLEEEPLVPIIVYPENDKNETKSLHLQLKIHYQSLNFFREQEAKLGPLHTEVSVRNAIIQTEEKIAEIKKKLKALTK